MYIAQDWVVLSFSLPFFLSVLLQIHFWGFVKTGGAWMGGIAEREGRG